MNQNPSENHNQKEKPSNPILTFFGLSGRALIFKLLIILAIPFGFLIDYSHNLYLKILFSLLATGCFIGAIIFYIKQRKMFLKDYQNVKIGETPLMPTYSNDFPMKDSIIMLLLILFGIGVIMVIAKYFIK